MVDTTSHPLLLKRTQMSPFPLHTPAKCPCFPYFLRHTVTVLVRMYFVKKMRGLKTPNFAAPDKAGFGADLARFVWLLRAWPEKNRRWRGPPTMVAGISRRPPVINPERHPECTSVHCRSDTPAGWLSVRFLSRLVFDTGRRVEAHEKKEKKPLIMRGSL